MENKPIMVVEICMGSACYARGNRELVAAMTRFIADNDLSKRIDLRGALCAGRCKSGPTVTVNRTVHRIGSPSELIALVTGCLDGGAP